MSNHTDQEKPKIKLNPAGPNRGPRRNARHAWGQGLMSSLPFAELVLLAGFLMTASMFLSLEDGYTAEKAASHPFNSYTP